MTAVYEDFLLRSPGSGELAWWSAYVNGGGPRADVVSSVLSSSEFKILWVFGIGEHYTGGTTLDQQTITSNLISSGDFVASEVALVSGGFYFGQHGGSNTGYVEALYQDVLLRPSDPPGLSYWVGRLNTGTATRTFVARHFIRTVESANRRVGGATGLSSCPSITLTDVGGLSAGTYCIVLDRMAGAGEVSYWSAQLSASAQLPSLWTAVAGSTEYYNNAQARF